MRQTTSPLNLPSFATTRVLTSFCCLCSNSHSYISNTGDLFLSFAPPPSRAFLLDLMLYFLCPHFV